MNLSNKKVCINCKYYNTDHTGPICEHTRAVRYEPVFGANYQASCFFMRSEGQDCGSDGSLFEEQ